MIMMGLGFIFMILFWCVIVGLIIWGAMHFSHRGIGTIGKSPMDIARERYAKGEITKDQFEQLKKDLNG